MRDIGRRLTGEHYVVGVQICPFVGVPDIPRGQVILFYS